MTWLEEPAATLMNYPNPKSAHSRSIQKHRTSEGFMHTNNARIIRLDATIAGPLLMLSAALLFTLLNIIIKSLGPSFSVWDIGYYRFWGGIVFILAIFWRYGNPFKGNDVRLLMIRLVQAYQLLWLVNFHDSCKCSHLLTIVSYPNSSPGWSFQERFYLTVLTPHPMVL